MNKFRSGSAFILVFVLTTLLALIGVMFLLTARVDKLSTSAIAENKQLDAAVDTVISQISQQLVLDTPGVDPNEEYYDYPDGWNPWLASLEPYTLDGTNYLWRQISDIYKRFGSSGALADIVPDYQDASNVVEGVLADADGDGIADSKWIELWDMTTNKGEPIYAAIRVIDNSSMLNVNTAYKFDPNSTERSEIDGSSQLQVNLMDLSWRPGFDSYDLKDEQDLMEARGSTYPFDENQRKLYENNVIWRYGNAISGYTPFDISDELELRNRYIINHEDIKTRLEELWTYSFNAPTELNTPVDGKGKRLDDWFYRAQHDILGPNDIYSYRHIGTTYNIDRIIDRYGKKMVNVNRVETRSALEDLLYPAVYLGLVEGGVDNSALAGQISVNMKDFSDSDSDMTVYSNNYYGFERPCIFISELVHTYYIADANDTNNIQHSYSIEVTKHYPKRTDDSMTDEFELVLSNPSWTGSELRLSGGMFRTFYRDKSKYYVIVFEDPNIPLLSEVVDFSDSPSDGEENVDPDVVLGWECPWFNPECNEPGFSYDVYFGEDCESLGDCNNTCENVRTADHDSLEFVHNQFGRSFKPSDFFVIDPNMTYCWRIDDVNSGGKVIHKGSVWSFTVGDPKPDLYTIGINDKAFDVNDYVRIDRILSDGTHIPVDQIAVTDWLVDDPCEPNNIGISAIETNTKSLQREMSGSKFIKRLWYPDPLGQTLGHYNSSFVEDYYDLLGVEPSPPIPIHFEGRFNNVGEIGKVFFADMYNIPFHSVGLEEINVRVDVSNPAYQQLFNYLTVFDPSYYVSDANETRIQGRININTAPWYVLAQLPWVSKRIGYDDPDPSLARAIVNYRDNTIGGFRSIGQLNKVGGIDYYIDDKDQMWFPDLTINSRTRVDGVPDDFEERDLIFARISDLVTVRSDVFTAYILVRLGRNGPQKRAMAILDRSEVFNSADNVKILKLYEVPDAR